MKYRKFGKTDLLVSEIGFGAWAIGGGASVGGTPIGWGNADDAESKRAIAAAIEAGINFFDTADFYGLGHSEQLLGGALLHHKDTVIATKVGHRNVADKIVLDYSKEYIVAACEESLRRLKRDRIDYYQLHSARLQHLRDGNCMEAMEDLKRQGKIRYWGLSLNTFLPQPEADFLIEQNAGDGFQLVFNLLNRRALPVVQKAAASGYGLIARMPLQFGLLTGKFSAQSRFAPDDHRSFRLTPEIIEQTISLLQEEVWPVGEKQGLSPTELALSYCLSFPEITTVIPGIRTEQHVAQNTRGLQVLSAGVREALQKTGDKFEPVVKAMEQRG